MVEIDDSEVTWSSLQIPENYKQMDEKGKQGFLSHGVDTLVKKIEGLNLGLHVLGNVRLINKLVITPIDQKVSIPEDEFDEAGVGFEFAIDIFTWAYNIELRGQKTSDRVNEAERATVVAFLGKLNGYLREKYNSNSVTASE